MMIYATIENDEMYYYREALATIPEDNQTFMFIIASCYTPIRHLSSRLVA